MSSRFTQFILAAMVLGIIMGALIFNFLPDSRVELAADLRHQVFDAAAMRHAGEDR